MTQSRQIPEDEDEPLCDDPAIVYLLDALRHDSPFARQQAARLWARAAPTLGAAVRHLLRLLKDPDREVRIQAAAALGNLGGQARRVLPELCAALKETALHDDNESVRSQAVLGLLQVGAQPKSEVPELMDSLRDELDVVRIHSAIALGECGRDALPAVPALKHASLWDHDPAVRVEAAVALWKIDGNNGPLVMPILIKALSDANELICWIAADCLGQMGAQARPAAPALRLVSRRHFKIALVRIGVAIALRRIDPQEAVEAE